MAALCPGAYWSLTVGLVELALDVYLNRAGVSRDLKRCGIAGPDRHHPGERILDSVQYFSIPS